jgi:hypothetical protein
MVEHGAKREQAQQLEVEVPGDHLERLAKYKPASDQSFHFYAHIFEEW